MTVRLFPDSVVPPVAGDTDIVTAMLAQLPGIVWAVDSALRCRFVSPAAERRLALRPGDRIGDGLPPSADLARLVEDHRRALAGSPVTSRVSIAGGLLDCRLAPLHAADGTLIGVVGGAEDARAGTLAADNFDAQRAVFAAVLEHAPEGIVICDANGRFIYANATSRAFAERDAEGTTIADGHAVWGDWRNDDERTPIEQWPIARALLGEVVPPQDAYKVLADGGRRYMQVAAAPIRDPAGAIIGATGVAIDVTARRQAELQVRELNQELEARVRARTAELEREADEHQRALDRLARSEQLLRDVINHSTAVIYLKDVDGRYMMINQHFERLFGVSNAEQVGRTDFDLFSADVAEAVRANDRRVLGMGSPLHIEETVPTAGRVRIYLSVKFPLRDRGGNVYGVCGVSTDITERKQMEAALRRSEATLASVIESSSDPICALSRDWHLVAMNSAVARFVPELIGSLPAMDARLSQIPEEFALQWRGLLERGMAGERFTVERALPIGGENRQFLVSFNPTVQEGAVTGVAIFGREITELRRAEEDARQHQAELAHVLRVHTMGEMAASLAHEVNQPLGAIANYAQGCRNHLRAGTADPTELLRSVEAIAREALRAGEITRRVRELLRKEEAPRAWVGAAKLIHAALDIIAPTARRDDVVVSVRCDAAPLPVLVDRIQIEQVVINLLLNAIEATRSTRGPRQVEVHISDTGAGAVEIAVSDTGPGVDDGLGERIYEPFLTTKPGGLGMGLAISRSIVVAHGGRLWHTPNPGGGTTFHVVLPADPER